MRPYRGLTKEGEWVYGWYLHRHESDWDGHDKYIHQIHTEEWNEFIEVIPESVGQFTGRKDIKDKEAYDGHIISVIAEKHLIDGKYEGCVPFNAKIFWESNMLAWFYEELEYGEGGHPLANCRFEIIGNKSEHPNLLEQK